MRRIAAALIVGVCVVGASFAQTEAPTASRPQFFDLEPSERPRERSYPQRALERGVAGVVHLCCRANAVRDVSCEVAVEWPSNYAFGESALSLMRGRRLTEQAAENLQDVPGATFRVPIRWQTVPVPSELDGVVARIDNETVDLCGPGTGAAPDYIVIEARRS